MAAGLFKIKEILPSGLPGTIFHWTSAETAPFEEVQRSVRGGGRAAPLGGWGHGGEMRSARTDYTGNPVPSEQVLGSVEAPQEFNGRWNDRYNYQGYAQDTWREFLALCKRGNLVEISFQGKGFIGLLKKWDFDERRDWDVRYLFSVSIHGSIEEVQANDLGLGEFIEKSPVEHRDNLNDIMDAMVLADELAPASHMTDGPADAVASSMASVEDALESLDDTLDQRDLNIGSPVNPVSPFSLLSSKFRTVTDTALTINQELLTVKSDINLAVVTAKSVLDFEDWSRSMRFHARVLLGESLAAQLDMKAKDSPAADRLYRPYEGESLMSVSRQVYGTPHQWHAIADANGLETEVLTGEEILIIPELGAS